MADAGPQVYASPVNFLLAQAAPPNIQDPAAQYAIQQLYTSMQTVFQTFINNCGIGPQVQTQWNQYVGTTTTLLRDNMNRYYAVAAEAISYGAIISIFGAGVVRNANAYDHTKWADGFCNVPGGVTSGGYGEFILKQGICPIAGATAGFRYWLSTANGIVANGPATGAGNLEQYIGVALTSAALLMDIGVGINH